MGVPHNNKKVGNSQKKCFDQLLGACRTQKLVQINNNHSWQKTRSKHENNTDTDKYSSLSYTIYHPHPNISLTLSHNTFILFFSPPSLSLTHTHTYLLNAQLLHQPYHTLSPYTANPYSTIFRMAALLPILLQNSSHLSIYSLAWII